MGIDAESQTGSELTEWLRSRGGSATFRELLQFGPAALRSKTVADAAIADLLQSGDVVEISSRPRKIGLATVSESVAAGTVADEPAAATGSVADRELETVATVAASESVAALWRRCACGGHATIGSGWFLRDNENAIWRCAKCDRSARAPR